MDNFLKKAESWVAASLLVSYLPFITEVPVWITLSSALLIILQLLLSHWNKKLPRGSLVLMLLFYIYGIYLQYGVFSGQDAATVLLISMLALKFMESNRQRDLTIVVFVTFILTLARFLYSQSILVGAYMIFLVWFNGMTLIAINSKGSMPEYSFRAKLSFQILLQSIPIMLVLFILFPRISSPLWGTPENSSQAFTGVNDSMTPGEFVNLSQSAAVAFRVKFDGRIPPQNLLYWRGPVLWYFDGKTWVHGQRSFVPGIYLDSKSEAVNYTVTMQPSGRDYLFVLDMPASIVPGSQPNEEFQLINNDKLLTLKQYKASSYLNYRINTKMDKDSWQFEYGLQLPPGFNPKTIAYGKQLRKEYNNNQAIIRAVLENFNQNNFYYTLKPLPLGRNYADDFLFKTKRGFCEHYASSFVLIMRAAGIPARIVTGYQGGEINKLGEEYLIVRQSDAHAWAEVWLKNQGWVRIDPTAAVSPERIEQGIDAALPSSEPLSIFSRKQWDLLKNIQLMWDSVNNQWNNWILDYNDKSQQKLLQSLGLKWNWQDMIIAIMVLSSLLFAGVFIYLIWQSRQKVVDPALILYQQFIQKCKAKGLNYQSDEGPEDFDHRASQYFPQQSQLIHSISNLYKTIRYGEQYTAENLKQLKKLIKQFK